MPNEITLKIPKIHKILMIISRTLGLISQGIFLLFAKDLKLKGNIANHHKSVLEKIKYIIRPW